MVIICFTDGSDWFNPNWVFRQLAEDVIDACPGDKEVRFVMEQARALGSLFLHSMEPALAQRVETASTQVAEDTLSGKLAGWLKNEPDDHEGQRMYLEAMSELLDALRRQERRSGERGCT